MAPAQALLLAGSLALAASSTLLAASAAPPPLQSRCPSMLGGKPQLQVRTGGGALGDTSLEGLNEVVWVGPECLEVYAGSPAVHKLADGTGWLFSHDFFASGAGLPLYFDKRNNTVQVFHSADGETWQYRSNVSKIYWANMFSVGADVYLLGTHGDDHHVTSAPNTVPMKGGPVTISKSTDSGVSWSDPVVILQGSYQTGACPTISVNGTLYRTMEDSSIGCGALVMWAKEGSDLLSPTAWSHSKPILAPPSPGGAASDSDGGSGKHVSWQEGSAVEGPSGEIYNMLRVNGQTAAWHNKAAATVLDPIAKTL